VNEHAGVGRRVAVSEAARVAGNARRTRRLRRFALHGGLLTLAAAWLFPVAWAIYTSLRPYAETAARGYVSLPGSLTFENYGRAWQAAELPHAFLNTALIVVPALVLILGISTFVAFAISRFSWRFNIAALLLLTAGNLLPPQTLITPLFRLFLAVPVPAPLSDNGTLYDQALGLIVVHVAIQIGFCTFVLSNFMKTLPRDLTEASLIDGASALQQLRQVVLPLSRAPLAALATLETAWLYNDFFWALFLMRTGDKRPITSALNSLAGEFFRDGNLLAAAAILIALPPLLVYLALQRDLLGGLTIGSSEQ
jgi:multiple sugar transport system permease protein